jgi:hypothetical protein
VVPEPVVDDEEVLAGSLVVLDEVPEPVCANAAVHSAKAEAARIICGRRRLFMVSPRELNWRLPLGEHCAHRARGGHVGA